MASLLTLEDLESFKNKDNYNEDAKELCERMAEGLQADKNLAEVQDEFNQWLSEVDQELEGEEGVEEGDGGQGDVTSEGEVGGGDAEKEVGVSDTETGNA